MHGKGDRVEKLKKDITEIEKTKKIIIFSGTTEGRMLAQTLAENGIDSIVSVATEYGEIVMPPMEGVMLHKGRMDIEEMRDFILEHQAAAVVDATHPFATAVSENIKECLKDYNIPYIRLQRDTSDTVVMNREDLDVESKHNGRRKQPAVLMCKDAEECASLLSTTKGNILLTTGSKDLAVYSGMEALKDRLFVRVLPGLLSISLCEENGIRGKQIIAMQGPFSMEMNRALIRQFDIQYLVTKESGRAGGFLEKIKAAEAEGITACVIGNPEMAHTGDSFFGVCRKISKLTGKIIQNKISLIGTGMGNLNSMTTEAVERVREADYVFGAKRLLEVAETGQAICYPYYLAKDIVPKLEELSGCGAKIAILFSGDTGFYSGCEKLYKTLQDRPDCKVRIYPGISSVAYLAASTGYSYQDAAILSIHGHGAGDTWIGKLTETIRFSEKTFLLMSGKDDVRKLGQILLQYGLKDCTVLAGYQLSYPEEKILTLSPEACCTVEEEGLYICLILNPEVQEKNVTCGIRDEEFLRDKVPMTKEEIRWLSVCKLHLKKDSVFYDIGSGTGSIAIETAGRSGQIQVYAIEKKPLALELIQRNIEKFALPNVHVIAGEAPACLIGKERTECPTHALIGGSSGRLKEILDVLYEKNKTMRVVIDAISLETVSELALLKKDDRITNLEILSAQVARARQIGDYQLMQGENPIYICSFDFKEQ